MSNNLSGITVPPTSVGELDLASVKYVFVVYPWKGEDNAHSPDALGSIRIASYNLIRQPLN
jgi:hypothetical protein